VLGTGQKLNDEQRLDMYKLSSAKRILYRYRWNLCLQKAWH